MLLTVLAALMLSLFGLLAAGKPSQAIVGGTEVKPVGKYPFMVALLYGKDPAKNPQRNLFCGGTLIDKDSVLTAAHCVQGISTGDLKAGKLKVIVGATHLGVDQGVVGDVSRALPHPGYNRNPDNGYDAAVLTLEQPVRNPKTVHLATLFQDYLEQPGRAATAAGWGKTWTLGRQVSWMREVQVPIRTDKDAESAYNSKGKKVYFRNLMVPAGNQRAGVYKGDSGGPLFAKDHKGRYTQIGIVSFGTNVYGRLYCDILLEQCPDVYTEANNPSIRKFITSAKKDTSPGAMLR